MREDHPAPIWALAFVMFLLGLAAGQRCELLPPPAPSSPTGTEAR